MIFEIIVGLSPKTKQIFQLSGTHRYFFKAYALDSKLNLSKDSAKKDIEREIKGRILAEGELIGLYKRK